MLRVIDSWIDSVTMYKLLLYYLAALIVIAIGFSAFGVLHYNPLYIAISTLILLAACWVTNEVFSYIFKAPTNSESSILTALILALIITPNPTGFGITFLLAVSGLAMASKYLLVIRKKHIFNPAAVAIALTALGPRQSASWWIGTAAMLPFVMAGGILLTRKIRRTDMVLSFFTSTLLATVLYAVLAKTNVTTSMHNMIFGSSVFFLGFVMLTEPLTSPSTSKKQAWYAILVGALLPPQAHFFKFYSSPELALLIGNAFSYVVGSKTKLFPVLKEKVRIATNSVDFVFTPDRKLKYKPGQYMEWTLPHKKTDSRGNRRYFTLASSPTEPDIRIGVKFYENGSSFKEAMLDMDQDTPIVAAQIAGDFVLPKNQKQKIVFIAGGIGVTPFRSMVKYLVDKNEPRSVKLFYSAKTEADIAYRDIFDEAGQAIGLQTHYMITGDRASISLPNARRGRLTAELLQQAVPDYAERLFYISGTRPMVTSVQKALHSLGVKEKQVRVDFFSGY